MNKLSEEKQGEFKNLGALFAKIDALLQRSQYSQATPLAISNEVLNIIKEAKEDFPCPSEFTGSCVDYSIKIAYSIRKWFGEKKK